MNLQRESARGPRIHPAPQRTLKSQPGKEAEASTPTLQAGRPPWIARSQRRGLKRSAGLPRINFADRTISATALLLPVLPPLLLLLLLLLHCYYYYDDDDYYYSNYLLLLPLVLLVLLGYLLPQLPLLLLLLLLELLLLLVLLLRLLRYWYNYCTSSTTKDLGNLST